MNPIDPSPPLSDGHWPASAERMKVPDTSMLPGSELPPAAAVGVLKQAVQGAHETIDRWAERAAPAVQQLGERLSATGAAIEQKTAQVRDTREEWVEGMRSTVRDHPLAALAAALALGVVLASLMRSKD